jgi:hypothetical protein
MNTGNTVCMQKCLKTLDFNAVELLPELSQMEKERA